MTLQSADVQLLRCFNTDSKKKGRTNPRQTADWKIRNQKLAASISTSGQWCWPLLLPAVAHGPVIWKQAKIHFIHKVYVPVRIFSWTRIRVLEKCYVSPRSEGTGFPGAPVSAREALPAAARLQGARGHSARMRGALECRDLAVQNG